MFSRKTSPSNSSLSQSPSNLQQECARVTFISRLESHKKFFDSSLISPLRKDVYDWFFYATDSSRHSTFNKNTIDFLVKQFNKTVRMQIWFHSFWNMLGRCTEEISRQCIQAGYLMILLDLSLDEEELKRNLKLDETFLEKKRLNNNLYIIGMNIEALGNAAKAWGKLSSVVQGMKYKKCFLTSATTGMGIQFCLGWIAQDSLSKEYTISNFISDHNEARSKRFFPQGLYLPSTIEKLINKNSQELTFPMIISQGGERTQAILDPIMRFPYVRVQDKVITISSFITIYEQWVNIARSLAYACKKDNQKLEELAPARETAHIEGVMKLIFQFFAPDISTLARVGLLPESDKDHSRKVKAPS